VVCDPNDPLLFDTTIIIIEIEPVNDPPLAVDDNESTPEDTPVIIEILNNDSDPDGMLSSPSVVSTPSNGMITVNGDNTVTYTPDENFVGTDVFTYEVCDDGIPVLCDTATVTITVFPVIDTITIMIPEDSMVTVCADSLTTFTASATGISICGDPDNGDLTVNVTCVTYTPDPMVTGNDTFCVVVCDPNDPLLCDTTIIIIEIEPVNDPPLAVDDNESTPEDTPVIIEILNNDSDPDGMLSSPSVVSTPSNGMITVNGDNTVTYTPDENFVGTDIFTYEVCDDGIPVLCDTATVTITVFPVIDTIMITIPEDSMVTVCADSLTTFTAPAAGASVCGAPCNGVMNVNGSCASSTRDMDWSGIDTFCVIGCDGNRICDTTIVIVTVECPSVTVNVLLEGPYNDTI